MNALMVSSKAFVLRHKQGRTGLSGVPGIARWAGGPVRQRAGGPVGQYAGLLRERERHTYTERERPTLSSFSFYVFCFVANTSYFSFLAM